MKSIVICTLVLLAACANRKEKVEPIVTRQAKAVLRPASTISPIKGTVEFLATSKGTHVSIDVIGLKPRMVHGIHVHQIGLCTPPDFESAGNHFDPHQQRHGGPTSAVHHPGDFGNITADEKGRAHLDLVMTGLALNGPHNIIGRSVVLHARQDDLISQPSGNSGERIACGIIEMVDFDQTLGSTMFATRSF